MYLLIHLFINYLSSAYYVPGSVLHSGEKTDKVLTLTADFFPPTLNKHNIIILQITSGGKLFLSLIVPLASYIMIFWEKD